MRWLVEQLAEEGNKFAFKALIPSELLGIGIVKNSSGTMGLKGVRGLNIVDNFGGRGGSNNARGGGEGLSTGAGGQVGPSLSIPKEKFGESNRGGGGGFRGKRRGSAGPPGALQGPERDPERMDGW